MDQNHFDDVFRPLAKMISDKVSQKTQTAVKSVLASLYTADESNPRFRYSGLYGILSLEIDRHLNSRFLRMYSLDTLDVLFECEMYYGFDENYRKVSQKFYAFDMLEGIIGFDFRTPEEAEEMCIKIKSNSKKMSDLKAMQEKKHAEEEEKRKANTFMGKLKGKFFSKESEKVEKKEQTVILNVQKKNWISFDPKTGTFDTENIPPEWAEIFSKLGYGKKELENKELAGNLFKEIVVYQTIKQAEENPMVKEHVETTMRASIKDLASASQSAPIEVPTSQQSSQAPEEPKNDLFSEICKGNFKLKPVKQEGNHMKVDASQMNKDERQDMTNYLLKAIKNRHKALHRFDNDEEEDVIKIS